MSTKQRLQAITANLNIPETANDGKLETDDGEDSQRIFPPVSQRAPGFKTGPGQMLAFTGEMQKAEGEIKSLREKLERYAQSMPTKKVDTSLIDQSRWANRHPSSYLTAQFIRLKDDIQNANGNVQPILIRPSKVAEDRYEIVFGHRRYMACKELGIPVLASISNDTIGDNELFAAMDRENRERADLSNFEQGTMYQRALDEGLYSSKRGLAEALGVSHTWVNNALSVANIPTPIVDCFRSPLEITHRHAKLLHAALEADRKQVLKRAEKIRGRELSASAVLTNLIQGAKVLQKAREIVVDGRKIGRIQLDGDAIKVSFSCADMSDEKIEQLQTFIASLAK